MSTLTDLTIAGALAGLSTKEFTAEELVGAHITAATAARSMNCFITETFEQAIEGAKDSDARRQGNKALALDGIPIGM